MNFRIAKHFLEAAHPAACFEKMSKTLTIKESLLGFAVPFYFKVILSKATKSFWGNYELLPCFLRHFVNFLELILTILDPF